MRYDRAARAVAAVVLAGGVALVVLDATDGTVRRYFDQRALTTDVLSGVLGLLFTLLVVDQVVRRRTLAARSKAVAAHVAIVLAQAVRTVDAVRAMGDDPDHHEAATDEQRTYMLMLLVAAPVLIEAPPARQFLESAQRVAAMAARLLTPSLPDRVLRLLPDDLDGAVEGLRTSALPLLAALSAPERTAVAEPGTDGTGDLAPSG